MQLWELPIVNWRFNSFLLLLDKLLACNLNVDYHRNEFVLLRSNNVLPTVGARESLYIFTIKTYIGLRRFGGQWLGAFEPLL